MRAVAAVVAAPIVRASVTVVIASASVTLDPRGLNPIVFDVVGTGDAAVLLLSKDVFDSVASADDFLGYALDKPESDSVQAQDAATQDVVLPKEDAVSTSDELLPWALDKAVHEAVYIDDFATRSVNGNYADQATTDDFSEPVDDLGWSVARAVADTASPGDAYAAAFAMAPINEPALAATDASVALVGKNVADTSTAQDSAPLVAFSRAGDQDSVAAADTVAQAFSSPKDEVVSAADALQPFDLTKNVLDAVAIDDFATRSFNGGYTDQATTDDFSEPVDDLGWDMTRSGINDPITPSDALIFQLQDVQLETVTAADAFSVTDFQTLLAVLPSAGSPTYYLTKTVLDSSNASYAVAGAVKTSAESSYTLVALFAVLPSSNAPTYRVAIRPMASDGSLSFVPPVAVDSSNVQYTPI